MLNNFVDDYAVHHALESILRHHHVDDPELLKHLALLINWVLAEERSKYQFNDGDYPPFLLVLLGQMGIKAKDLQRPPRGAKT